MSPKKLGPRRLSSAKRCRLDAMVFQNPLHRVRRDLVAEIGQSSLDSIVSPTRIRFRHANDQFFDLGRDGRTSRFTARVRPLPRDELTVPAKDCIRSDQSRHFLQQFPAELLSLGRKAAALLVVQVERASQLLAENAVLLLKVFKDLLLLPVEPTCQEADKEDMWRDEQVHRKHGSRSHLRLHGRSRPSFCTIRASSLDTPSPVRWHAAPRTPIAQVFANDTSARPAPWPRSPEGTSTTSATRCRSVEAPPSNPVPGGNDSGSSELRGRESPSSSDVD